MSVKAQGGKVITKGNKVSCSCCGGCCMYPARYLGELFSQEDLPDRIIIRPLDQNFTEELTLTREGQQFGPTSPSDLPSYEQRVVLTDFNGEKLWTLEGRTIGNVFASIDATDCLIEAVLADGVETGEYIAAKDDFDASYAVNFTGGSATVSRVSMCVWRGTDSNGCPASLRYVGTAYNGEPSENSYKWLVSVTTYDPLAGCGASQSSVKEGAQNLPVGEYGIATVSEL